MNLYLPTSIDDPFGMGDLEWLYRKQDIDGAQLSSRLATLAPISFADKSKHGGAGTRDPAPQALLDRHLGDEQRILGQRQSGRRVPGK